MIGFARGTAADIAALYGPNAILVPRTGSRPRIGRSQIRWHAAAAVREGRTVAFLSRRLAIECRRARIDGEALEFGGARNTTVQSRRVLYRMWLEHGDDGWRIVRHTVEWIDGPEMPPAPSRIQTSAVPRSTGLVVLPPAPFGLPASPPVIVAPHLPFILTPRGAMPRQAAPPAPVPETRTPDREPLPAATRQPLNLPPLPVATVPDNLTPELVVVVPPPPPAAVPTLPPPPLQLTDDPPVVTAVAENAPLVMLAQRKPDRAPPKGQGLKRAAAVASFARRAPPPAPARKKQSAQAPKAAQGAYRSGRFVDNVPTFD
jgi:hypothetical protein